MGIASYNSNKTIGYDKYSKVATENNADQLQATQRRVKCVTNKLNGQKFCIGDLILLRQVNTSKWLIVVADERSRG